MLEPGRYLVAEAGVLMTRVIRVKEGASRSFLIVDAAMNDLLRPSLYDAWHEIVPRMPTCVRWSATTWSVRCAKPAIHSPWVARLPRCCAGDLLMIAGAGAYGAAMASNYNSRPLPAEVLVDGRRYSVIRRRQSVRRNGCNRAGLAGLAGM